MANTSPRSCSTPRIAGTGGPTTWSMARDEHGYRTYRIKFRVAVDPSDGPFNALNCPGLPSPGSAWQFDNDFDQWAYCTQEAQVTPVHNEGDPNTFFDVEFVFTTKPAVYCPDDTGGFDDPLLRADVISGGFVKYTEEATLDRDGNQIVNSAWEQIRGPQVEFDKNRQQVRIKQHVADVDLGLIASLIDTVNASPMWGFDIGCVKFSGCQWEKHYHTDCTIYYTRVLEFDLNPNTFDRDILDEGTKALAGDFDPVTGAYVIGLAAAVSATATVTSGSNSITVSGAQTSKITVGLIVKGTGIPAGTTVTAVALPTITLSANATASGSATLKFGVTPDPNNPLHFKRFEDPNGNLVRVLLNGAGKPYDPAHATAGTDDDVVGKIHVGKYDYTDLTLLDLPTTF